jgi:TPR repeat protein
MFQRSGAFVKLWIVTDNQAERMSPSNKPYLSMSAMYLLNCTSGQFRALANVWHSDHMTKGVQVDTKMSNVDISTDAQATAYLSENSRSAPPKLMGIACKAPENAQANNVQQSSVQPGNAQENSQIQGGNTAYEAYKRKDYVTAARLYESLANSGDKGAQNQMGYLYSNGFGVPKDEAKAVSWYEMAAKQGYKDAQFNLGGIYFSGKGVPMDYSKSKMWYEKAAAQGDKEAQQKLIEVKRHEILTVCNTNAASCMELASNVLKKEQILPVDKAYCMYLTASRIKTNDKATLAAAREVANLRNQNPMLSMINCIGIFDK